MDGRKPTTLQKLAGLRREPPICLGEENLNKTLSCGHKFHIKCIKDWYNKGSKTCPICRAEIKPSTSKYTIFK